MVRPREHFLGYVCPSLSSSMPSSNRTTLLLPFHAILQLLPFLSFLLFIFPLFPIPLLTVTSAATRGAILRYRYLDNHAPRDRLHVSTFAGGLTGGSIGGLISTCHTTLPLLSLTSHLLNPPPPGSPTHLKTILGGTPNILPGAIMFALFGLAGQSIYNHLDDAHTQSVLLTRNQPPPSSSFWTRLAASKYVPVKVLSDAEYESMLRERLLAVEAEIALVDEKIERLRVQGVQSEERKDGEERRGEEMGSGESR